jgi:hypothetical protein
MKYWFILYLEIKYYFKDFKILSCPNSYEIIYKFKTWIIFYYEKIIEKILSNIYCKVLFY